jgi:O-antigen/teichoic acid export membrane protein
LSPLVVKFAFGPEFKESINIFRILFGAFLLSNMTNVINYFGYGINKPEIITLNLLIQLIILITAGVLSVPIFGANGMANSVLISRIIGLFFILYFIYRILWKKNAILDTQ